MGSNIQNTQNSNMLKIRVDIAVSTSSKTKNQLAFHKQSNKDSKYSC